MLLENIDNFIYDNLKSVNIAPKDNDILYNFLKYLIIYKVKYDNKYYDYIIKELINKNLEQIKENNRSMDEEEEDFLKTNLEIINTINNINKYDFIIKQILTPNVINQLKKIIEINEDNINIKNIDFFNSLIEDIRNLKNLDILKIKAKVYPEIEKNITNIINKLEKIYSLNLNSGENLNYENIFTLNMNLKVK